MASTRSPEDSDRDGIPDAVEMEWGLDPGDPTDSRRAEDGCAYTNLERYLNQLVE